MNLGMLAALAVVGGAAWYLWSLKEPTMQCALCQRPLRYSARDGGYVHEFLDGPGATAWYKCRDCEWESSPPVAPKRCPKQHKSVYIEHHAKPGR